MQITQQQLALHYIEHRALLREYFPRADRRVIDDYLQALRAYDLSPTLDALDQLLIDQQRIVSSIPTIELDP